MGQVPKGLTPYASARHFFGAELRRWRERRGLSQHRLGEQANFDASLIGKVEKAERMPSPALAQACDRVLETEGALARLWPLVDQERQRAEAAEHTLRQAAVGSLAGWQTAPGAYAGLWQSSAAPVPATAIGAANSDALVVPVLTSDGKVVFMPIDRRMFLLAARAAGAASLAGMEWGRLAGAIRAPERVDAEIVGYLQRVLDEHGAADNLRGGCCLIDVVAAQMRFIDHLRSGARGEVRNELLTVGAGYAEFAGWLHHDSGDAAAATHWTDRAMEWAQEAGNDVCFSSILTEKSNQAKGQGDADRAISLARAAQRAIDPLPPRTRAVAIQQEAQGYGLAGDELTCHALFDTALELLAIAERDQDPGPGRWCTEAHIEIQRATCWLRLKRPQLAIDLFERQLAALPARYHRDRGVYLGRQGIAHAADRDPEQAVTVGYTALAIGRETGSARILAELHRLDASLTDWVDLPAVAQFHEAIATG
ncbi:MAG: helix-turn-helix domain-containing protein [Egibacteraceae bacterium]